MCEKDTELILSQILIDTNFNDAFVYSTLSTDNLKQIFQNCSKSKKANYGYPDRIYFDLKTLIIFECKYKNIKSAIGDMMHYLNSINVSDLNIQIYGVAFVNKSIYQIYNKQSDGIVEIHNKTLCPKTFGIDICMNISNVCIKRDIHQINNYMRSPANIPDDDKGLYISLILISLKYEWFGTVLDNLSDTNGIYSTLLSNLEQVGINSKIFSIIPNNQHLYKIMNMCHQIYKTNPNIDLLNDFYSEFVSYNNTDGKSIGIVLTPHHIVKLMVDIMNISNDDIVLDLCTGTGSFILESYKHNPKQIVGCELQYKLYTLLKCNMIIRDIDDSKYQIFNSDCMLLDFSATKSLINPPYGLKEMHELEFVIKQLDSLSDNGECISIIPKSKLISNNRNNKFKHMILSKSKVLSIIICNKKLFYPNASVECCILHLQKVSINQSSLENNIKLLDYSNDGYVINKQCGMVISNEHDHLHKNILIKLSTMECNKKIKYDNDWVIEISDDDNHISPNQYMLFNRLKQLEIEYENNKKKLLESVCSIPETNIIYKQFKLPELLRIVNNGKNVVLKNIIQSDGIYDIVTSSAYNNGIHKELKSADYAFNGDCLTLNKNGSVGYCFYQQSKFIKTTDVMVLELIDKPNDYIYLYKYLAFVLTTICCKKFNYSYKITIDRINNILIELPIIGNDIDIQYIKSLAL